MVANIVNIHLAIYANCMFMFVFNKTRHWTYWINWIQFHMLPVFCFKIRFHVFLSWSPRSPKWLVSFTISFLNILCKSNFPHACCILHYLSHLNDISQRAVAMIFIFLLLCLPEVQIFSSALCHQNPPFIFVLWEVTQTKFHNDARQHARYSLAM
jgi:hypothetical protein